MGSHNKPQYTEQIEIQDDNGDTIAAIVYCAAAQHLTGMRDPVADVRFEFKAIEDVTTAWTGVPGSVRVIWRGNIVYWAYAMQHYQTGHASALYCSPAGSPSLDPPTSSAVSATLPHKRYTAKVKQNGTGNPSVTVFENTTGHEITWTRHTQGIYRAGFTPEYLVPSQSENRMVILSSNPQTDKILNLFFSYFGIDGEPLYVVINAEIIKVSDQLGIDLEGTFYIQILFFA